MSYGNLTDTTETTNNILIEETVKENLPLVHSLARRYINRGVEYEDLFQTGCIGLYKAAARFKPELGFRFSTYAASLITGEIRRFLRDDGMIKVSRQLKEVSVKSSMCVKTFTEQHGRTPTLSEISELCGETIETLTQAIEATSRTKSIYEEVSEGKTIADTFPDNESSGEKLINSMLIKNVIKKFPPRERKIIIYRYYYDKTQKEVASLLDLSQVQVSRIEKRLIEKLRYEFSK